MLTGLALFVGLLDVSERIELHLLGRQAAEVLVPRRHWVGVTQTVMLNDPSIPKSFECWNNDIGYSLYLDLLANKLINGHNLDGKHLIYLASNGKYGEKPNQVRMLWISWDTVKVPTIIRDAASSYAYQRQ